MKHKTYSEKNETVKRNWRIVDAKDRVLGRVATRVADILRGKDKANYTPHIDCGDFVVIINASQIKFTGNKLNDKKYYKHSGFRGGMKVQTAKELMETKPEEVIKMAVWGMLPKGPLGRSIVGKLKVYPGVEHPHEAQQPVTVELGA